MITMEQLTLDREQLDRDRRHADEMAADAVVKMESFNLMSREEVLKRVVEMRESAKVQTEEAVMNWAKREEYRTMVNLKNESLAFLLNRSAEAIQTVISSQEGGDDKGKKGGGAVKKGAAPAAAAPKKK